MPVTIDNMINRTNAEIVQILSSEPAESCRPPARAVYTHMRTNGGSWRSRFVQYENAAKDTGVSSSEYFNKK
ncbi:hypothetical protein ENVG_00315 [Emiliania huxleyi virus 84]|nr:hypothetical protein ENVG_00315 [Emiliania huxleyi virus 84]AEP15344.1 hypothetical protein EOVG_00407 [Emiliania huxleyi virus 88]